MGDTGSLFFGAFVVAASFQMQEEIVGLIVAAVFIIEMLSSLLQTTFFRFTKRFCKDHRGRRIFRMAPLHHHFEKCGWGEIKIVVIFSIVELLFCAVAWFAL